MPEQEIIAGLDIGSTAIRLAVGQRLGQEEKIHIIGSAEVPAEGISKGIVSSIEDAVSAITGCLEKAERMAGRPIESAWVGISGSHIISQESRGVVAVARSDGEISEDDVARAIEAARTVVTPPNYEILHVIPKGFIVDGQAGIKDPVGMTGVRLEVDTQIIQGLSSQIKNLTKAVYRPGLNIEDLVLSILATAEAVITSRQKELGVAVVNIGGSTTGLAVYEEGDIIHTAVLPVGSDHITSDIAIGLRIPIDAAEKIKLEYGSALPEGVGKREEIDVGELEGKESNFVSKKYIAEITEARVEEIFSKINNELKKIDRSGKLPAGAVLVGGGAKLNGLVEAAKKQLRLPASLGKPLAVTSAIDKVSDPAFATAIGLVIWGSQVSRQGGGGNLGKILSRLPSLKGVAGQAKKMLGKFLGRR
ncbi:MAG: cell division protein FtsA [Candidatus Buchananbacteria bacterium RIFCSPHIGHO2_02_FULL_45_11b]|uniref:Cell division protein FtsA n=3 Tax=Candidatus Buchananiibacteriota TaxID=1817903 RepID=A0A1G1Y1G0_9BACT|nr:MAG: cell division protein FtsA [Candidatus Buchananbacteria bacterium RIFCSPHIGHO2_01_FULL_46_12]OGY52130.1 MAG: cell division protein FtsA [Candidatus Buchananbacteria bacterium RIFCSPHIGHO2_02_FULL_45_11b]OGY56260.1 MAG: cell division protein FtsA [Candidatus Buchananbacteria bacterium RIFCSPLOWO2_02_FULL_46_11b]